MLRSTHARDATPSDATRCDVYAVRGLPHVRPPAVHRGALRRPLDVLRRRAHLPAGPGVVRGWLCGVASREHATRRMRCVAMLRAFASHGWHIVTPAGPWSVLCAMRYPAAFVE